MNEERRRRIEEGDPESIEEIAIGAFFLVTLIGLIAIIIVLACS